MVLIHSFLAESVCHGLYFAVFTRKYSCKNLIAPIVVMGRIIIPSHIVCRVSSTELNDWNGAIQMYMICSRSWYRGTLWKTLTLSSRIGGKRPYSYAFLHHCAIWLCQGMELIGVVLILDSLVYLLVVLLVLSLWLTELCIGLGTEGIDSKSVGNTLQLHESSVIEAFNLKAAILWSGKNCKYTFTCTDHLLCFDSVS